MTAKTERAKLLLENEIFNEAFQSLKDQMVSRIELGRMTEEERKNACTVLWVLNAARVYIESIVVDEKIKEFNLIQKKRWLG